MASLLPRESFLEVAVGEVQVSMPVVLGHVVLAAADVVADRAGSRRLEGGAFAGRRAGRAPSLSPARPRRRGGPAAPGVVGDHQRESLVLGAGPERRLAET